MNPKSIREAARNRQMMNDVSRRCGDAGLAEKFERAALRGMKPGNIGDINRVIWPFFFTFDSEDLVPGRTVIKSFSVTQEASFLWRMSTKAVFLKTGVEPNIEYTYLDPVDPAGGAPGLKFSLRDAQSTREFNGNRAQSMDTMGFGNFPDVLPSSQMMLPNATMQITLTNEHATNIYRPWITFIGYRLRIEDSQNILSKVTG